MELKTAKRIVKRINDKNDGEIAHIYNNYSGRGMLGLETTGVVLPSWAIPKNHKYRQDNMGSLNVIIY